MLSKGEQIDYYTFENDKHMFSGRSGKQRTKREVAVHTNRNDPNGHSRKIASKLRNTEMNQRNQPLKPTTGVRKDRRNSFDFADL